ncbi:helix-hairpin-helix domain-containing protein [Natronosporangium hydrolyticum]|uniref:Helix-hairpin-helix domain-containing protein n=1 Tax=Natronosporangium hydrolyticum TaxID=2811111 RepID=A0A895YBZ7_9ACTN|nr:helix-hairpin-helix domain-containing protein [Natronosporangium hydrolyticum]QSB15344.1 helix-hairpin-helix domain-containing protein [Natronosporangium hydrolyticum]
MRIKQFAATAAAGMVGGALALTGVAQAEETPLSIEIDGDCASLSVTFVNTTNFDFFGDVRIDGAAGTSDEWSDALISQGPLAGEVFGDRYEQVALPAGQTTTESVDLPAGSGERLVEAVVRRGPEQEWYVPWQSFTVDCGTTEDEDDADAGDDAGAGEELDCVDVNTADAETLQLLKHIGEARAQQILELRPFTSVEDLARVNGLSVDGSNLAELVAGGGGYLPLCGIESGSGGSGDDADADALPLTGNVTGMAASGAGVLLAAGAGLYLAARRRRVAFTA